MTMQYWLAAETKTGIVVRYDEKTVRFSIGTTCHPEGRVIVGATKVTCVSCGAIFSGEKLAMAVGGWASDWNANGIVDSDSYIVAGWVAAWTGISEMDFEVVIT